MKLINITYGLKGQSNEYTYLVDGDAKVGQIVFPAFRHLPDGKIAKTVGIIQSTNSLTSKQGINMSKILNEKGVVVDYIGTKLNKQTQVPRGDDGRFVGGTGFSKTIKNDNGKYVSTTPDNYDNAKNSSKVVETQQLNEKLVSYQEASTKENGYVDVSRRGNVETYEEYTNRYFNK